MDEDLWSELEHDETDDELAEDVRRFREEAGLPADPATVTWFVAEHRAGRHDGGMWETSEEAAVRWRDEARIDRAWTAIDPYLEARPDIVGGRWVDHGSRLGVHVNLTRATDEHRDAMRRLLPEPELLHVHRAEHSLAQLEAVQAEVTEDDVLADAGIEWRGCGLEEERNLVVLEAIAPDGDRAARLLAERYGTAVELHYLGPEPTVVEPQTWQRWSIDGLALTLHYLANATFVPVGAECVETSEEVRVTVLERMPVGPIKLPGALRQATVELREPLGARRVVDGATGEARPARVSR